MEIKKHSAKQSGLNLWYWLTFLQTGVDLVWKDAIGSMTNDAHLNYTQSYRQASDAPQINNVSLRFTYFLDYLTMKKAVSGKI